jgi:choline kinase
MTPDVFQLNKSRPNLFILGAGRPSQGVKPSAIVPTSPDQVILDWIIAAFKPLGEHEVHFMGGYSIDQISEAFPNVDFVFNPDWNRTGSGNSLLRAPFQPGTYNYVCYADTVISPDAVALLCAAEGEVIIAIDTTWQERYEQRSYSDREVAEKVRIQDGNVVEIGRQIPVEDANAEFTGLIRISSEVLPAITDLSGHLDQESNAVDVPSILTALIERGISIRTVDITDRWAELNEGSDLARFIVRSKAETLEALTPLVKLSVIDESVKFTVSQWQRSPDDIIGKIHTTFPKASLAVRSSASSEDGWQSSHAGEFHTALNVAGDDSGAIVAAIESVIESFGEFDPKDHLLIQEMVTEIAVHGVVVTRSMQTGAPYYTINYDDTSGDTTTVTQGNTNGLKVAVVYRKSQESLHSLSESIQSIIPAVKEIEYLVGHDALDVEFAITKDAQVHILQIRPLTTVAFQEAEEWDRQIDIDLASVRQKIRSLDKPTPSLFGDRTILGIMPDWNPAEIIGVRPRKLSLSVYRYLITDEVWSAQRREYGYRDVAPQPLLHELVGHPYIDTRAMFNSFIPASLPDDMASRLVNFYLDRLEREPHLHDKVEFEIVLTCLTFDFDKRVKSLIANGFSTADIGVLREALSQITATATARREVDNRMLMELQERYSKVMSSGMAPIDRGFMLLEDCKRFGTLPFAHMARTAFIAVALLRSLEAIGITTPAQTAHFMEAVPTVASDLERDSVLVGAGDLDWEQFVERYGHLRPGTYDVTIPRYADDPEHYLRPLISLNPQLRLSTPISDNWDKKTRSNISEVISELGFDWTVDEYSDFVRQSIQDREHSKFIFSKNLSAALEEFVMFGEEHGITRDQLSYLDLRNISRARNDELLNQEGWLLARIDEGKRSQERSLRIELPSLISHESDIEVFELRDQEPNFVTTKRLRARVVELEDALMPADQLEGRIVLIPSADPGYDWLLARPIAGLITMYGGANSHMSIRAAELSLPAAIGVGERLYASLSAANELELDCESRRFEIIR